MVGSGLVLGSRFAQALEHSSKSGDGSSSLRQSCDIIPIFQIRTLSLSEVK